MSAAVENGVDWLQLRERDLEAREWLAWARELAARAMPRASVIVNRRVDIALVLGAGGVHLGFDAMTPQDAAGLLPHGSEIGVSTHAPEEVRRAREAGASYAHLAPIWSPISKPPERPAMGASGLGAACAQGIPVLAQGGLTPERCGEALAAGAAGIAVTGDILLADDPGAAAARLRAALDQAARDQASLDQAARDATS